MSASINKERTKNNIIYLIPMCNVYFGNVLSKWIYDSVFCCLGEVKTTTTTTTTKKITTKKTITTTTKEGKGMSGVLIWFQCLSH